MSDRTPFNDDGDAVIARNHRRRRAAGYDPASARSRQASYLAQHLGTLIKSWQLVWDLADQNKSLSQKRKILIGIACTMLLMQRH